MEGLMKEKLVIFDLDGTILDTLEDLKISVNSALVKNGYPEHTIEEVRTYVGNGIRMLIHRAVPEGTDAAAEDKVHRDFRAHYDAHCTEHTAPYDGIPELLRALRKEGILTAVLSNKADHAVHTLCDAMFPGLFDVVRGECEGIPRKPTPDAVYAILEELQIAREDAVYVGDSDVDIMTAQNAGLSCISVAWGFRTAAFLQEHGAAEILSSPDALRKRLLL